MKAVALANAQYDAILRDYNRRQLQNKHILDEHISEAYQKIPRLKEIDSEIAALSIQKAKSLLGEGLHDFDLEKAICTLSDERIALLFMHGYPADYLEMHYHCPYCKDTGYVDGQKCICFKKASAELLYTQSRLKEVLQTDNFDHFCLDYYPEESKNEATGFNARETAQLAFEKAWQFITHFEDSFGNLFLYGDTGVGKTFLSYCIAKELLEKGYCVIYFSAFELFEQLAKSTFTYDAEVAEQSEPIFDCDLLIIDDLGTELTNSFVASSLFLCINERLRRKKATIISTNLTLEHFAETYSERIFSRISSNYTILKLIGNDIRIQKKLFGGAK
ncbi:DNA replication protein DnaC [Bacteroidia bacterium]|nr:DNA replication protein DnaC [Bacteroidia bacterium]